MAYIGPYPLPVVGGGTGLTSAVAFSAYLNTPTANNVTGDGTAATVVFDTALLNLGTGYAVGTGIFTAPVTGNYLFSSTVLLNNLAAGHTSGTLSFTASLSSTPTTWIAASLNPKAQAVSSGTSSGIVGASTILAMTAADTIKIVVTISGSTKTVGFNGASSVLTTIQTFFSGHLLL